MRTVLCIAALSLCAALALGSTLTPQEQPLLARRSSTLLAGVAQQDTPPLPVELTKKEIEQRAQKLCQFPNIVREPSGPWQVDPRQLLQSFFSILAVPNPTEYDIAFHLDRYIEAARAFSCPGGAPGEPEKAMFNFLKKAIGTGFGGRIAFDDTYADLEALFNGRGNAQDLCRKIMKVVAVDKEVLRQRAREVREKEQGSSNPNAVMPPLVQADFVIDTQYTLSQAINTQWAAVLIYTNAYFGYVRMLESYARMSHNCDNSQNDKDIRNWYTGRIAQLPTVLQKAVTDHNWADDLRGWRYRVLLAADYRHAHRVTARFCSGGFVRKLLEIRDAVKYGSFSGPSLEFELNEKCRRLIKSPTNWLRAQEQTAENFMKETFVCVVQSAQRTNAAINKLQGIAVASIQDPEHNCPSSHEQEFEPEKQ